VFECLRLAGGVCEDADISGINQAVKVTDGQQLYVPSFEEMRALRDGGSELMNVKDPGGGMAAGFSGMNPAQCKEEINNEKERTASAGHPGLHEEDYRCQGLFTYSKGNMPGSQH
jgi:hypothetical protein